MTHPWDGKPQDEAMKEFSNKIIEGDKKLRDKYYSLPEEYPKQYTSNGDINREEIIRKRLKYRSKQRGMLEVDLILGKWSNENISFQKEKKLLIAVHRQIERIRAARL